MSIEEQLERALRAEATRIDPPVTDLVSAGVTRGRQLRRRRRAALGAGSAVAAAALVGGVVLTSGDPAGPPDTAVAGGVASDSAQPAAGGLDPDAVIDTVVDLLPAGDVSDEQTGVVADGTVTFEFVHDDGDGASSFSGSVAVAPDATPSCPEPDGTSLCTVVVQRDGGELALLSDGPGEPPGLDTGSVAREASSLWNVGMEVRLSESDPAGDAAPGSPLPWDVLGEVVTDDVWLEVAADVLAEQSQAAEDRARAEREAALEEAGQ